MISLTEHLPESMLSYKDYKFLKPAKDIAVLEWHPAELLYGQTSQEMLHFKVQK